MRLVRFVLLSAVGLALGYLAAGAAPMTTPDTSRAGRSESPAGVTADDPRAPAIERTRSDPPEAIRGPRDALPARDAAPRVADERPTRDRDHDVYELRVSSPLRVRSAGHPEVPVTPLVTSDPAGSPPSLYDARARVERTREQTAADPGTHGEWPPR